MSYKAFHIPVQTKRLKSILAYNEIQLKERLNAGLTIIDIHKEFVNYLQEKGIKANESYEQFRRCISVLKIKKTQPAKRVSSEKLRSEKGNKISHLSDVPDLPESELF